MADMDEARPLQIITSENVVTEDSDKPESKFELQKEALSSILSKVPEGMKVSVVSVVGAFRTGKSFLLTLFLRYLRHCDEKSGDGTSWLLAEGDLSEGNKNASDEKNRPERNSFAWRGGQDRMTTGIWMWSEPFIRYSKSAGEKVAILLMDTQGMFDNETTMSVTAQIFGISTLVSSFQIYNVQNSIGEDKLQHLALFSEYGRLALSPSTEDGEFKGEKKSGSDDNDRTAGKEKQGETELSSGAAAMQEIRQAIIDLDNNGAQKPFQHLQFLVRDWSNFEAEWPAEEALTEEMKEYFGTVIKYRDQSDLQSTRDQISRCFDTVNCFLLPHPGTAVTKRTFSGSLDNLDPLFKQLVNVFARNIFDEKLEAKRVHSRHITAPELLAYFDAYVNLFQSGDSKFPKAMTMLDATANANNRNAFDLAINRYKQRMNQKMTRDGYMSTNDLRFVHESCVKESWELFKEIATMGSLKAIEEMSLKLNDEITEEFEKNKTLNDLRNPYRNFEAYFIPACIAAISWFISILIHATCTAPICQHAKTSLSNVYMTILVLGLVAFRSQIMGSINNLKMLTGDFSKLAEKSKVE